MKLDRIGIELANSVAYSSGEMSSRLHFRHLLLLGLIHKTSLTLLLFGTKLLLQLQRYLA